MVPQINIHKIFIPQRMFSFLTPPPSKKILKFKILNPLKMVRAYIYRKKYQIPPWDV